MTRYNEIVNILAKHGFSYLINALKIKYNLISPFPNIKVEEKLTEPVRLRMAFEELGPTFIKFAQIMSTRVDLFPQDYIAELSKLQDNVPAVPFDMIEPVILKNLKISALSDVFATFNTECIASASIGQVYRATTKGGQSIVVKVKKPGIQEMIEEDIKILMELFRLLENNIEGAKFYQPVDLLNEFAYTIREELDYVMEGQQADRVRKNFEKVDGIYVPKIYWEWSNRDILVMEEIKGIKVNDLAGIEKNGYDRSAVARKATRLILKSILVDGFFHADPHPGNIFIMEGESIGIIDFGMMGRLSHGDRSSFVSLMQAYVNRNAEDLVEQLLQLAPVEDVRYLDQQVFTRDLERVLSRYYDLSLQEVSFTNVINDSFDIIHKYRLKLPTRYFLLFKSLIILDGIGRELDSKFNILDEVKPFVKEQLSFYNLFPEIRNEFLKNILNLNQFAKDFPKAIKEILRQIREGDFRVDIRHEGLKEAITELDILANRVSLAMIISALIVGVSLLLQVYKPIHQMEVLFSWVLTILIMITVTLLFWLLYDLFIKSRRW